MDKFKKRFVSFAATIVLIAAIIYLGNDSIYSNQDYTESTQFKDSLRDYKTQVSYFELNRLSKEQAIKKLAVSVEEIKDYRLQYGSLSNQVSSIKAQYEDDIKEAKDIGAKKVEKKLIAERDAKLEDITKNFEDESYVEKKIIADKKEKIEQYYLDLESNVKSLHAQYPYFAYDLKNVRTGETFQSGDLSNTNFFKETYNSSIHGAFYDINSKYDFAYKLQSDDDETGAYINKEELIPTTNDSFTGTISISDNAIAGTEVEAMDRKYSYVKNGLNALWIVAIILGIAGFIVFWRNRNNYKAYSKSVEVQILISVVMLVLAIFISSVVSSSFFSSLYYGWIFNAFNLTLIIILPFIIWIMMDVVIRYMMSTIRKYKDNENVWEGSLTKKIIIMFSNLMLKTSVTIKIMLYLTIIFLAGFGFFVVIYAIDSIGVLVFYLFLFVTFVVPTSIYFFKQIGDMNKIMKATERIVNENSAEKIHLSRRSEFFEHANFINQMQVGVETSQIQQNKSERLKTELITNVSHDLRTPLTSIITYTELLKKEDLTQDERLQYIDVLDKKSQRLKTLIDDLFEVSKMASGNIELHEQDVDMTQLVKQALGEHEADIEKSQLRFNLSIPDTAIMTHIDGQKYWRAIDNLISNAIKYAMDGTRVFVSLEDLGNTVQLTIKNISKFEISEDVEELYERFKRADASRHTEGSGLGLAIAQSIVDLHKGKMDISIDGDLFKVTIIQPK